MRLPLAIFLLLPATLAVGSGAQVPSTGRPEVPGVSSVRLLRVDSLFLRAVSDHAITGAVVTVVRDDKTIYTTTFGHIDGDTKRPMTPETMFRLASMTKPITVVAALILYEEGRFLLSDPVSKYLPEFRNMRVISDSASAGATSQSVSSRPARARLLVRQLFNHTAGFTYGVFGQRPLAQLYDDNELYEGLVAQNRTIGEAVKTLATLPLLFEPGERFQYGLSNDVLGRLVEVVSGKTLEAFTRERIFLPLGMTNTYFFPPDEKLARIADYWPPQALDSARKFVTVGNARYTPAAQYFRGPRTFFAGGAGVVSTVADYVRFARMLLNGGELDSVRILSPTTVGLMTTNSLGENSSVIAPDLFGDQYGMGVGIRSRRGRIGELESNGTFMWAGASHHHFWVDPCERLIGVVMTQKVPPSGQAPLLAFRTAVYQTLTTTRFTRSAC